MKKVVFASLLACATTLSCMPVRAFAQAPAAGANGQVQMSDAEYKAYTDAMNQTNPQQKAAAIEAYLTAYPNSKVKQDVLVTLMATYASLNDPAKTLDAAGRVLQLDPNNLRALTFQAAFGKGMAQAITDPAQKQQALDNAAAAAQKGLQAPKPASMSDADFKKIQDAAFPYFYSAIAAAAMNKKDSAAAIDALKKELASVPVAATQDPQQMELPDTYQLALAYMQSNPPDYLDCAFYAARFTAYAPEPYKSQVAPTAKYCYKKYHGGDDGYDAVVQAATANLNPPADFQASVKPAPTPADVVNQVIASTPDLGTLAVGDKEFIMQNGTPDQADKVWQTIKGKSVEIPGALVIESSPTVLKVAVSDDAVQSKTADFTFNMKPMEEPKTAAERKQAEAIAAAIAVGQTVTLDGTYDSYTAKPIMITMSDGEVVLPKPAAKAPVHHTTTHKK